MPQALDWFQQWRSAFDYDRVDYGAGGIEILRSECLLDGQIGFAVAGNGESLVGTNQGDWHPEWVVIGFETACGDPLFVSAEHPYPVFTAMHGEGAWGPKLVAPSLASFRDCLAAFREVARGRSSCLNAQVNQPTREDLRGFFDTIRQLTNDNAEALGFWAVQVEIDLDTYVG